MSATIWIYLELSAAVWNYLNLSEATCTNLHKPQETNHKTTTPQSEPPNTKPQTHNPNPQTHKPNIGGRRKRRNPYIRRPLLAGDRASETFLQTLTSSYRFADSKSYLGTPPLPPTLAAENLFPHIRLICSDFFHFFSRSKKSLKIGFLSNPPKISKIGSLGAQS